MNIPTDAGCARDALTRLADSGCLRDKHTRLFFAPHLWGNLKSFVRKVIYSASEMDFEYCTYGREWCTRYIGAIRWLVVFTRWTHDDLYPLVHGHGWCTRCIDVIRLLVVFTRWMHNGHYLLIKSERLCLGTLWYHNRVNSFRFLDLVFRMILKKWTLN